MGLVVRFRLLWCFWILFSLGCCGIFSLYKKMSLCESNFLIRLKIEITPEAGRVPKQEKTEQVPHYTRVPPEEENEVPYLF